MKKVDVKNKKKNILILIIILVVVLILIFLLNFKYLMALNNLNKILDNNLEDNIDIPTGILTFIEDYKGESNAYKVAIKSLEDVSKNVIPKYYLKTNDMTESEIEKYYEKNKNIILIETGIETYEEYKSVISKLHTYNQDTLNFVDYEIDISTIDNKYNRVKGNLVIIYENDYELVLNIEMMSILKKDVSPIKYTID